MDLEAVELEGKQRVFYNTVRESIICLLVFLLLYVCSYLLVTRYQRHFSREDCYTEQEDHLVYRITTWLCSFALSVGMASALLLPVSIISNEVIVLYPTSDYVQWLNTSLLRGLWNMVFFGCNVSLFVCLPFAYFFSESAGLAGSRKGVMSRVYETVLILLLLCVLVFGLSWLLLDHDTSWDSWFLYLPLLYSVMSLLGVVVMGICTPLGVSHLFTVLGALITSPKPTTNVEEELEEMRSQELAILEERSEGEGRGRLVEQRPERGRLRENDVKQLLTEIQHRKAQLERHLNSSPWERHILCPLAFLSLLAVTLLVLLLVATNSALLVLYSDSHHVSGQVVGEYLLGSASTSHLGLLGALVEIVVIIYVQCASVVGMYSIPPLHYILPSSHNTPLTHVMANCVLLLMLTAALPLTSKTLGITQFTLLGSYKTIPWLSNTWLLLCYNSLFLLLTTFIISRRVSKAVLREASKLLASWFSWRRKISKSHVD